MPRISWSLLADNVLARHIHYRLRYHVYCLETNFEDATHFPYGEEQDEFDELYMRAFSAYQA